LFVEEPEDDNDDNRVESREHWILENRQLVHPEPLGLFRLHPTPSLDIKTEYVQVIAKLANTQSDVEGQLVCFPYFQ